MVVFVVSNGKFFSEMYLRCFNPSKISLRLLFYNKSYRHVFEMSMFFLGDIIYRMVDRKRQKNSQSLQKGALGRISKMIPFSQFCET